MMRAPCLGGLRRRQSLRAFALALVMQAPLATAAPRGRPDAGAGRTADRGDSVETVEPARAAQGGTQRPDRGDPAGPRDRVEPDREQRPGRAPGVVGLDAPTLAPTLGAVLDAAYAAAGFDRDLHTSWIRRARLSGLIPWVTVRTSHDASWQDAQTEVGHAATLELRATWRLDRLLFDTRELQAAAIDSARRRERRQLAARVIRAYFAWRRAAQAELTVAPGALPSGPAAGERGAGGAAERAGEGAGERAGERADERADEAAAQLDALTDGWFSQQLTGPPRGVGRAPGSVER